MCPIVAIIAKFLWGWWKPKGCFSMPHIQSTVFQSELHACRPAVFFWGDRVWILTVQEFKTKLRVFHRCSSVSFLCSRLSCSKMNWVVVNCWKWWTHLFPALGPQMLFCLAVLFSPPSGEPLQGVPFLQEAYPSHLPTQKFSAALDAWPDSSKILKTVNLVQGGMWEWENCHIM